MGKERAMAFVSPCKCKSLMRKDLDPKCPWHGLAPCRCCGEEVWSGGLGHYVSSHGHGFAATIIPYYTCGKK